MEKESTRRQFLRSIITATALASPIAKGLEALADTSKPTENKYQTRDFTKDPENVLLARMIFGEARGCEDLERIAVAYTAVNRANDEKKWNGETVKQAILKPWQYSCFNESDPNRKKLMDPETYDAKSFYECLGIADKVLAGKYKDPTNGATHYFNPDIVKPSWADKMRKIGKLKTSKGLSKHEFYKEE